MGAKYLSNLRLTEAARRVVINSDDLDRVDRLYHRAASPGGVLDGLDRRDIEGVARYVNRAPDNGYVWERIKSGSVDGLALLLHEVHELDLYSSRGLDPWNLAQWAPMYREFHGRATIQEHSLLLAVARRKGYDTSIGALILNDHNAAPPNVSKRALQRERKRNLRAARAQGSIPNPTPDEVEEAHRFWTDIQNGRVLLEDVDFDAISLPGEAD